VIDGRFIQDHFPGVGRFCYNLVAALARADHGYDFIVPVAPARLNSRFDVAALASPHVVPVPCDIPVLSLREQLAMPRLARAWRADLWHAPHPAVPLFLPCRWMVSCHDAIAVQHPASLAAPWRRPVAALLLHRAVRAARAVVTVSEVARADVVNVLGAPAARTTVIHHGVEPRFAPQSEETVAALRQRLGLPPAYALHLSSGKPHKNLPRLLDAWRAVAGSGPGAGLVLAIAGGEAPSRREVAAADPAVRFLGPIREDDLPGLYAGARLFVFPSLVEGFGLPVLEAMACGTPVVCSNASSLPEVAGEAAVLCDPSDTAALAAAMTRMLADPDLRTALRQRGLARAARFTWGEAAERFVRVYRDALAQAPRAGRRGSRE